MLELNASDVRSKKAMQEQMGDITGSRTLSFAKKVSKKSQAKRVIVMDEVDGMGAGDRSGVATLIQMIKDSRVPIICICNDRQSQKLKSLIPYCLDLRFRRPTKSVLANRAIQIAATEGLTVERNAAEAVAESCGNDMRQILNCLQMWASKTNTMTYKHLKDRESSINKDEILRVSLFDAARLVLEGRRGLSGATPEVERESFFRRSDAFFVDYSFVGLLVQQNYLKVAQGQFTEAKRTNDPERILKALEETSAAADAMSDFACAEQSVRADQNWGLLPWSGSLCVKTGFHAGGPKGGMLPGFPEFTAWLGKNSSKGKKSRMLQELAHHMNYNVSGGSEELRLSYLPVIIDRVHGLLTSGGDASAAIEFMDEYGIDRDDVFEKFDEFLLNPKNSFGKLDSKQKAAFTRAYNAQAHRSQALVASQGGATKKTKRGAGGLSETMDPDAIQDDTPEVDSDDDGDEDMEAIKAKFQKKGRKKAPAKRQKKK